MDSYGVREYNGLIRLMNACNSEGLTMLVMLRGRVEKVDLKLGWLASLLMWEEHADMVEFYLRSYTKEPITESAYQALLSAQPERWAPARELANVLTKRKQDWTEAQLEDTENEVVYASEWEKETARHLRALAALVKEGALEGRREGSELRIRVSSFNAWSGEDAPVLPEFGFDYDLAPDDESRFVRRLKTNREEVRNSFGSLAFKALPPGEGGSWPVYRALAEGLKVRLKADIEGTWGELTALDAAFAAVAREFDGEDPLRPETRKELDEALESLREAQAFLRRMDGECDLPSLDEEQARETLDAIKYLAEQSA
jgi:hypothetical protein